MADGIDSPRTRTRMDDSILQHCNETELLSLARRQGLGILRRGIPTETLIKLVTGEEPVIPSLHLSETTSTRVVLEQFIQTNITRTRSQLPGCDGKCTTFPCSEGRHALCFVSNEDLLHR
jgi:hypothetical protein